MAAEKQRVQRVNIRLSESVMHKLQVYSDEVGMAPATVCAQFVCEALRSKAAQSYALQEAIQKQVMASSVSAEEILSDPNKLTGVLKAMSAAGLIPDDARSEGANSERSEAGK